MSWNHFTVNAKTTDPVAFIKKEIDGAHGARLDLQESLIFAEEGKVKATVSTDSLDNINKVFERMRLGDIEGRVVLDLAL